MSEALSPIDTPPSDTAASAASAQAAAEPEPAKGTLLRALEQRHENFAGLLARGAEALADPEFVHDLRVGSRRMGEAARLLRDFTDKPTARAVASSLRGLRRAMGALRDSDVTREHLEKWKMPGSVKQVAREAALLHAQSRPALEIAASAQMGAASLAGSMVVLSRILEERGMPDCAGETEEKLRAELESQIRKREKEMRRLFGRAAKKQTAASLHEARIGVKKLRYVLELAADAGTQRGAKKKIRLLKQLQELLGAHHDVHVIGEELERHLKVKREKPIKNLAAGWRKWQRGMNAGQSKRAAVFFAKTYAWINEEE
jgi:CHAD domain-containing protein